MKNTSEKIPDEMLKKIEEMLSDWPQLDEPSEYDKALTRGCELLDIFAKDLIANPNFSPETISHNCKMMHLNELKGMIVPEPLTPKHDYYWKLVDVAGIIVLHNSTPPGAFMDAYHFLRKQDKIDGIGTSIEYDHFEPEWEKKLSNNLSRLINSSSGKEKYILSKIQNDFMEWLGT